MPAVLVVDDDPMVCVAIEACLKCKGFEVTVVDCAEAGLHALEKQSFDVMLIDVFVQYMRGFESMRIFHVRAPEVPIVAMAGCLRQHRARARPAADDSGTRRGTLPAKAFRARRPVDHRE